MALVEKITSQIEINVAADILYNYLKNEVYYMPNLTSCIQDVAVHEGHWDDYGPGSIKVWNYTMDGKPEVFKEKAKFNDEKREVTLIGMDGDVFKDYKTYKSTFQFIPKDSKHSWAVLSLKYEKRNESSPKPYKYIELMKNMTKGLESHLQ